LIAAFLQLYNENENGHLRRVLENCRQWSDEIFIYDDRSTDDSYEVYLEYTDRENIIVGANHYFQAELFNKARLLDLTLAKSPDWIVWVDGDDSLDAELTYNLRGHIAEWEQQGVDGIYLHNRNLWRHPAYYRIDNYYDGLFKVNIWRNTGSLHYSPTVGLHQNQHPLGMANIIKSSHNLLHYGFASEEWIAKKYLTYKSLGQSGWALDRLIDEQSTYELRKAPLYWFPVDQVPDDYDTIEQPKALSYSKYRNCSSWEDYLGLK
jgi:glycosyltransferase involved in cell wall biosynthesis